MVAAIPRLSVMRRPQRPRPRDPLSPHSAYRLRKNLVVAGALLAAFFAVVVAVSYPAVAFGAVLALATGVAARSAYRRLATRRREKQTRQVCVPGTDVCLEA